MRYARALWFALVALSTAVPFGVLLLRSVAREWFFPALLPPAADLESWQALAGGRFIEVLSLTLLIGGATGALAAAGGLPVGRAIAALRGPQRAAAAALAFLPVAAPPIALATGLQVTFLSLGLGGTVAGVVLAHTVPALAYAALFLAGIFVAYDDRIEVEARSLGATPLQVLRFVRLPLLRRPIAEAAVLGFLVSWAQVPLTLIIGGGAVRTLPVEVLAYVQAGQDRYAATGALLLVVPALAAIAAVAFAVPRTEVAAP